MECKKKKKKKSDSQKQLLGAGNVKVIVICWSKYKKLVVMEDK